MESTLHRQLKESIAADPTLTEVRHGRYWIDAVDGEGRFVEVQFASLSAISRKVNEICPTHLVRIVKPLLACKYIETLDQRGHVLRCRKSPKRLDSYAEISELLHFTNSFPRANLQVEFWHCEVTETRQVAKRRHAPAKTIDYRLRAIQNQRVIRHAADLWSLLPARIAAGQVVCSRTLAELYDVQPWQARQFAYVLNRCGAIVQIGKRGNSKLYQCAA